MLWRDRLTQVNITITDNVPPVISRVSASYNGTEGTEFGIGQQVRFDLWEKDNETGLEGVISIESFEGQYFHRRKPLTWDDGTSTYHYVWDTSDLKARSDYLVTTELWDVDDNRDRDGVAAGRPDLTITLRDITPPVAPVNLTLEAPPEGSSLVLTWDANTDDTEVYTLHRLRGEGRDGEEWAFLINLTVGETEFMDQGLENDVPYSYRIMAWDEVPLPSPWSQVVTGTPRDTVPPGKLKGLSINAPPEGGVLEIAWDEATDDAAAYLLFRDGGNGFEPVGRFARGTVTYVDRDVVNDQTYYYLVAAEDASGNRGPDSDPVLGLPLDTTPPSLPVVEPLPDLTNLSEHTVIGTAEPLSTVIAMVNQEEVARMVVGEDGSFTGTIELTNGVNRVSFKCFDASLNPSGATSPMMVQVDLNAPYVTSTFPGPDQKGVPIVEVVSMMVSEALLDGSVEGQLEFADTGVSVPATVMYSTLTKTITVTPNTQLEKGTTYRVRVDGTDPAGNHLTGGALEFTTELPEEPEPALGGSMLMVLVLLVLVVVAVAVLMAIRMRRRGGTSAEEGPAWEQGYQEPIDDTEEYDPRDPETGEMYEGRDWEEY